MYGHVETLAKEIQKGANSVEGVEATLYQVSSRGGVLVLDFDIAEVSLDSFMGCGSSVSSQNPWHDVCFPCLLSSLKSQVHETLPEEVLSKMYAPPKSDVPFIEAKDLPEADGFLFGFPTRYGMMAAQFKAFLDATGGLWRTQSLAGKPAGLFISTGSQGGGQETTA